MYAARFLLSFIVGPAAMSLEGRTRTLYDAGMPDDLYNRDALAWSEQQANLLRRLARGERVNDVDWDHVVEEIEDVGLSELNAVHSYLLRILVHLLKLHRWPDLNACQHWRSEIAILQADAERRYAPSMRRRIDVEAIYAGAIRAVAPLRLAGNEAIPAPPACPVTLEVLLTGCCTELEAVFLATSRS